MNGLARPCAAGGGGWPRRCAVFLLLAACASLAAAQACVPGAARGLRDASALRALADRCRDSDLRVFVEAIVALNALPPPAGPRLALRAAPAPGVPTARVMLRTEVYFDVFEAHAPDGGLRRLDELLQRMGSAHRIEKVELAGSEDRLEGGIDGLELPRKRAGFVRDYFVAAGVPEEAIETAVAEAAHDDSAEGRARDRAVRIRVRMLRAAD